MIDDVISIAIDGPASAGKSTVAKKIAEILSINYVDTGAMYRAITLKTIEENIDLDNRESLDQLISNTEISFKNNRIMLDGRDVSQEIRDNSISNRVSNVAKIKEIRSYMLRMQRDLAKNESLVMDGRDIASSVLPNADYKFFVTASIDTRAERRYKELLSKGQSNINFEQIKAEIAKRDHIDASREISPLVETWDSIRIDTSNLSVEESIKLILSKIEEAGYVL